MRKFFSFIAAVLFAGSMMADNYVLFSGELVEGDYLITYDDAALKASLASNRFQYTEVTDVAGVIADPAADLIWHLAKVGDNWTMYNADQQKYAGSTNAKNQGALLADATTDNAKWNATGTETYEFENIARAAGSNPGNKWLRKNGTYGFACYAEATGGALTLYKKQTGDEPVVVLPTVTIKGSFDNWGDGIVLAPSANQLHASATVNVPEGTYEFKVLLGENDWRGIDGENNTSYWFTRANNSASGLDGNCSLNMTFVADVTGEYTFTWTFASNALSAEYPLIPITCAEAAALAKDKIALLNEVVVTYVNGSNTYVKDASGYELIFASAFGLVAGDVVNGFIGKSSPYNGLPELKPEGVTLADLQVVAGEAPAPEEITAAPTVADINKYLIIKGVSVVGEFGNSKSNLDATIGEETFVLRNNFQISQTFEEGKLYDIVGVGAIYNTTLQLYFISASEHSATAIDNTDAAAKAVKFFENGQLIILKNGVRYNAQGAIVK